MTVSDGVAYLLLFYCLMLSFQYGFICEEVACWDESEVIFLFEFFKVLSCHSIHILDLARVDFQLMAVRVKSSHLNHSSYQVR